MAGIPGRKGREFARARAQVLRGATHCQMPNCKFPGKPLDFDGPPRGPLAPTVDHIVPVSLTEGWSDADRRAALNDPRYMRPAHYGCNAARGNRREATRRHRPTRDWGL